MPDMIKRGPQHPRHRPPRWLVTVAAVVLALGLSAAGVSATHTGSESHSGSTARQASSSRDPSTSGPMPTRRTVTEVGHPLLPGVREGWQLFARTGSGLDGSGRVIRLQLAEGRITRTPVPRLPSGGPVSFLAGPHQAVIRPLDYVPGYVVPDGESARRLTGPLGYSGPAIPGPKPGQVWVPSRHDKHRMRLVTIDGTPTGTSVRASSGSRTTAGVRSDGAGYLLARTDHGVYDVRPSGWRTVTDGSLVAVGPTRWLVRTCHDHRCSLSVINRHTGDRRRLGPATHPRPRRQGAYTACGVISPDGRTAALLRVNAHGPPTLQLLDLTTGVEHSTPISVRKNLNLSRGGLVWAPDSRQLFTINANRHIAAVNRDTGRIDIVAPDLPPVAQLAFRDATNTLYGNDE